MVLTTNLNSIDKPELLDKRWKDIKTAIFKLVENHKKSELILGLIKLRENYTSAPTLSAITNFTGFDIAINTIQRWDWDESKTTGSSEIDVEEIGRYGAELMILHTLRESLHNFLLTWDNFELTETEVGCTHFQALSSYNVEITGSRGDVVKKRFAQGRLSKHQRQMDPVNKISSVKRLYMENSILMLLRAPLPFYQAMRYLSGAEQDYLLNFHSNVMEKVVNSSKGLIKVRLKKGAKSVKILSKLTPDYKVDDMKPSFICAIQSPKEIEGKIEFQIGIGSLTMFSMFLLGFNKEHLDEKARRAEKAVREVIESSGYFEIVESNTDVIQDEGEVITEIDIVLRSRVNPDQWVTIEVKDFSFWKGWVWGAGSDVRKKYYTKAIEKLPVKEEFICEKHKCQKVISIIVTSIPEPFSEINGIRLVYLSDLNEELSRLGNLKFIPRKKHQGSNFLIRYFEKLDQDYDDVKKLEEPKFEMIRQCNSLKHEIDDCKDEYESFRVTYNSVVSEYDTLVISKKFVTKRLLKDTGEKHYQIEAELDVLNKKISKTSRERKLKSQQLKAIKEKYSKLLKEYKKIEIELQKISRSKDRLLASRLF